MTRFLELTTAQQHVGQNLRGLLLNFPKPPYTRAKIPLVLETLGQADKEWASFLKNDNDLRNLPELDLEESYFKENYEETLKTLVKQIQTKVNDALTAVNGKHPEYNLLDRGQCGYERMFTDDGKAVKNIKDTTEKNQWNDLFEASSGNTLQAAEDKSTENGGNLFPNVRQFFDNVSFENLSGSMPSVDNAVNKIQTNMKRMIKTVHDALKELDSAMKTKAGVIVETRIARKILSKWDQLRQMHAKLLDVEPQQYDATTFYDFEDIVQKSIDEILATYDCEEPKPITTDLPKKAKSIKMPQIEIPKFAGDYSKWTIFKDLFAQLVDQRDLTDAEKFMYLRGSLVGEALEVIQTLRITAENYELAWELLEERYENPRQIIKSMLNKLFQMEKAKPNSFTSLKKTYDSFRENMFAVKIAAKNDTNMVEMIFHQLLLNKLDIATTTLYEQNLEHENQPTSIDELLKFVAKRFRALENVADETPKNQQQGPQFKQVTQKQRATVSSVIVSERKVKTCQCSDKHHLFKCPKFLKLNVKERFQAAKDAEVCLKCLKPNHATMRCSEKGCSTCKKPHNVLLHFPQKQAAANLGSTVGSPGFDHVFLGTAVINVMSANGTPIKMRVLLDSGAQLNIMSEKMLKKTGLKTTPADMQVTGIGEIVAASSKRTTISLSSLHSAFTSSLEVFIMKTVTTCQPLNEVDISGWNIPKSVQLADPKFNIPDKIDLLIGSELFYRLLVNGLISIGDGLPDLQNTVFGWVVIGRLLGLKTNTAFAGMGLTTSNITLQQQVEQFWKVEEKGTDAKKPLTDAERKCEIDFQRTTVRQKDGRFQVKLQFVGDPESLGSSKEMAIRRFIGLERRFKKDPQLKEEYCKFMQEYIDLGHMAKADQSLLERNHYVIPHHSVLNPESSTTKFRVVFDASAKTTNNISLNDLMANGPVLQQDLFSIMVRFRIWRYVFSADIGKMYRQVEVDKDHQRWQLIVWRSDVSDELEFYVLKTVTYGTKCASYLAIRALQSLAESEAEKYPIASLVAKRDFNVDDVMTGSDDLDEAVKCQRQLREMLPLGKFELHKWCANHPLLLDEIPVNKRAVSLEINAENSETKALGMKWIPSSDIFSLKYEPKEHLQITKRTILSETAQLFDPLGLVNPVILKAKVFIQQLWNNKMDWDDVLPHAEQEKWMQYRDQLPKLTKLKIQRHVVIDDAESIQLHAFSDASELAYGSALYVRSINKDGKIQVNLLCSKSRVAPIGEMKTTLPRLELMGAVVAADLTKKVLSVLERDVQSVKYWTDSEIVLSWLYNDACLKTFVANRVNKVKRNTIVADWRHVDTKSNPADLISRGLNVKELEDYDLWWHGPKFLSRPESEWPESKPEFKREPTEEKVQKSILTVAKTNPSIIAQINHGNSINRWQRIVAYCVKFFERSKTSEPVVGMLTVQHLKQALTLIIKHAQDSELGMDIKWIKMNKPEKTKFKTMTPVIDADGVLRVGGRLQNSNLSFEQQHPAILPYQHEVTRLIMQQIHLENKHVGPQALLALTREKYWPIKGKVLAKSIVGQCILCSKAKPKLFEQVMSSLPKDRLTPGRCFLNTGIDFAGPIIIHYNGRGNRTTKAYICVFVCFSTKAVHLEPAVDLSMPAFLRCLKRFIARRGIPQKIYSDNAGNFKATNKYLEGLADMFDSEEFKKQIMNYCWDHKIEWKFIPPRSPHFGGLWESAVKSAKQLLIKILHNHRLVYDELATVLAEIEAILNSRPLSALSDDPNDVQPLTAGHFIIGAPLRSINDSVIINAPKTQQWSKLMEIRKEFWKRWTNEYLHELQAKKKWRNTHPNAMLGRLVMIRDDRLPPLQWKIGRINELMPDKDGVIRVVCVKTSSGVLTRAIHELAPLPSASDDVQAEAELPQSDNPVADSKNKKELNAEAPEFNWNTKIHHPDAAEIDKKQIIKVTRKIKQKKVPNDKPMVNVSNSPRTTRSGKIFGIPTVMATILGILFLAVTASAQPCNTTKFQNNPGLFFEKMGQLSLTNNAWTIVCHLDMNEYWKQTETMNILIQHMETTCPTVHPDEHCAITIDQLKHQLDRIIDKNQLIKSFTNEKIIKKSTRSVKEQRVFSDERKNGGWLNVTGKIDEIFGAIPISEKENLEQIFNLRNDIRSRQKRGWFDGIGIGAKEVFGILNEDDAKHYDEEIKRLKGNDNYLKQLIYNQTLIQEMTANVMRTSSATVLKQILYLNKTVENIKDKDETGKTHLFNSLSLQALTIMTNYKETQNAVIQLLTEVFHGKIPPAVITPSQLKQQLQTITKNIGNDLMVPGDDQRGQISQLYTMLSAKVSVTDENLIVKITVPLISREYYHLYHIVPVPFSYQNKLHSIVPATSFMAVNLKQDHFYMLSKEEKQTCKVFENDVLICNQNKPLFSVLTGNTQCEMAVLLNPQDAHNNCKIIEVNKKQVWITLATQNNYLYTMNSSMDISMICETSTTHCTLKGTGIIHVPEKCIVKSESIEVTAKHVITGAVNPIMLVPPVNIADNMPKRKSAPISIENWDEITNNAALDVLDRAIKQQKDDSSITFIDGHDIHHYTIGYSLLFIMVIVIGALFYTKQLRCPRIRRTVNISDPATDMEIGKVIPTAKPRQQPLNPAPAPAKNDFSRETYLGLGELFNVVS